MSPFSAPVLGGAALVSSPALWNALVEGTSSPTVALSRYLVSILACWLALEVVGMLVGPTAAPEQPAAEEPAEEPAEDQPERVDAA